MDLKKKKDEAVLLLAACNCCVQVLYLYACLASHIIGKARCPWKKIWLDSFVIFAFSPCILLDPIYSSESSHQWNILRDLCGKVKFTNHTIF